MVREALPFARTNGNPDGVEVTPRRIKRRVRPCQPSQFPEGYHTATPYLIIQGAAKAIEFYKKAFGATELLRMTAPDGKLGHAEIKIGDSPIMLADEQPEMKALSPESLGGSPISMLLYVEDRGRQIQTGHCRRGH